LSKYLLSSLKPNFSKPLESLKTISYTSDIIKARQVG